MEAVQGLEDIVRGIGGFGSTGVSEEKDIGEKKEVNGQNERTGEENDEKVKNETLKGSDSGRKRTKKSKKTTEGSSRLSRKRQIISIKQLKRLVKKKTLVFFLVVW